MFHFILRAKKSDEPHGVESPEIKIGQPLAVWIERIETDFNVENQLVKFITLTNGIKKHRLVLTASTNDETINEYVKIHEKAFYNQINEYGY